MNTSSNVIAKILNIQHCAFNFKPTYKEPNFRTSYNACSFINWCFLLQVYNVGTLYSGMFLYIFLLIFSQLIFRKHSSLQDKKNETFKDFFCPLSNILESNLLLKSSDCIKRHSWFAYDVKICNWAPSWLLLRSLFVL